MTILDNEGLVDFANTQPDSVYEVTVPDKGMIVIPITDKHASLAFQYFNNNWYPGKVFNFRKLSKLSACVPGGGARDFTADGILEGQKLAPWQVRYLFMVWLTERNKRFPAGE